MKQYVKPIKCGNHTHKTWAAAARCRTQRKVSLPNFKETTKEKLERLGACGMGYPSEGLPCIRPTGHNPLLECFALVKNTKGEVAGVWMTQDSKEWTTNATEFPADILIRTPLYEKKAEEIVCDRRGLVAHSRGKS